MGSAPGIREDVLSLASLMQGLAPMSPKLDQRIWTDDSSGVVFFLIGWSFTLKNNENVKKQLSKGLR